MYFELLELHRWAKRFAAQPKSISSAFTQVALWLCSRTACVTPLRIPPDRTSNTALPHEGQHQASQQSPACPTLDFCDPPAQRPFVFAEPVIERRNKLGRSWHRRVTRGRNRMAPPEGAKRIRAEKPRQIKGTVSRKTVPSCGVYASSHSRKSRTSRVPTSMPSGRSASAT